MAFRSTYVIGVHFPTMGVGALVAARTCRIRLHTGTARCRFIGTVRAVGTLWTPLLIWLDERPLIGN